MHEHGDRDRHYSAAMPGSLLEVSESAGHCPFNDEPQGFVDVVTDLIATTDAPAFDEHRLRRLRRHGDL